MTNLPVCRLCKCDSMYILSKDDDEQYYCSNFSCGMADVLLSYKEWCKLMYVPAKKKAREPFEAFDLGYERGYNAAIDDMEKGGD